MRVDIIKYLLLFFSSLSWANGRVVTLSPALTQLIFELQHGDSIVGASEYSDYPEAAKKIPRIGTFYFPNLEEVLKLKPQWILEDGFTRNESFHDSIKALHLKIHTVTIDSIEALFKESEWILREVYGEKNEPVLAQARSRLEKWMSHPRTFKFLIFTWIQPSILASRPTFFSDIFSKKGGKNLISQSFVAPYLQVSDEWLMEQEPDIVFSIAEDERDLPRYRAEFSRLWPKKKVHAVFLNPQYFGHTSFSFFDGLNEIESQL